MQRRRSIVAALALLMLVIGVVSAPAAQKPAQAHAIVGSWDAVVTIEGQPPFRALATFNADGTTVESSSHPSSLRSPAYGVWSRTGQNVFAMTRLFFRFNPATGAYLGTTKVNATVTVSADRKSFTAVSRSEMRDPAGALVVGGLRSTAVGTRMHVERITDES